jgi:ectoine hydroxylase-related dioxygenase (phytanoyl-CoA dioxygenase family)
VQDFHSCGYLVADVSLSPEQCDHLIEALPPVAAMRGGIRGLISHPTVLQVLRHRRLAEYLWSVIGRDLVAVKATLFDKTAQGNWQVHWHQDRVVAVRERLAVAGFGPWSAKAGILHVEPPTSVLDQMLAIRFSLDDSRAENGPLRVIPGSHHWGKLDAPAIEDKVSHHSAVQLHLPKGSLLLMRPLLVHSSASASAPAHRRVLHIEFAPADAISPLQWHTSVPIRRAA